MEVNLRCARGNDDCWNLNAIVAYADQVNAKEARLAGNPDLTVIPGKIACQGCVVNQWGNGTFCSAQLTETQVALAGERPPLPEDAFASTSQIPGFKMVKPGSGKMAEGYVAPVEESAPVMETPQPPKRGLRRLFSR